jgi:tetratricopeptide (TPR) repeat protein
MEGLFQDRLSDFHETLAFHFARSRLITKAVHYLVKSGEKSLARYAVEESHQYFKKAYDILASKGELSEEDKLILIDILSSWGNAFYYLGEINEFVELFSTHEIMAESLAEKEKAGMFYVWLGVAHFMAGRPKQSYEYLSRGLAFGKIASNQKVIGYACSWLTWACAELGLFDEGLDFGEQAQEFAKSFASDQYLFFKSLGGICFINFFKGDAKKIFEDAKRLLEYAERNANNRSTVFGHWMKGFGHLIVGDMKSSQICSEKAIEVALDPAYAQFPISTLGGAYFLNGQLQKAEDILQPSINFCEKHGMELLTTVCQMFQAPVLIAIGHMVKGERQLENVRKAFQEKQRRVWYALSEYFLGEVNLQIAIGPKPSLSIMAKNVGFLVKSVPFAAKNAEKHFNKAIELFKEIGMKGFLGQTYLSQGLLFKANKRTDEAKKCVLEAIDIFQECDAKIFLTQAKEVLDSMM